MRAAAVTFLALGATVDAFAPRPAPLRPKTELWGSKVGVYYGTEGQNTEAAADLLVELLNAKIISTQPVVSFDWSPDKEGLACMACLDQSLRVMIVTKLHLY